MPCRNVPDFERCISLKSNSLSVSTPEAISIRSAIGTSSQRVMSVICRRRDSTQGFLLAALDQPSFDGNAEHDFSVPPSSSCWPDRGLAPRRVVDQVDCSTWSTTAVGPVDKPGASPRNARAWRRVEEFLEWRIQFNQLDAAVPALRASSPDRRHFWRAFTAMAAAIESKAAMSEDAQLFGRRAEEICPGTGWKTRTITSEFMVVARAHPSRWLRASRAQRCRHQASKRTSARAPSLRL